MVARWLRLGLALEAAALLIASVLLARALAWSAGAAVLFVFVGFFAINSVSFFVLYPIALYFRRRVAGIPRLGPLRVLRGIVREWLAFLAVFGVFQPFERWWMGEDGVGRVDSRPPPLLLVPGYVCNRGQWWWLRRCLRARGFAVATVNLEPPFGGIDDFAEQLRSHIEALLTETGAERVTLIAHSMGGLVARAYLKRHGNERVSRLITLGSPHRGTIIAHLGLGRDAQQMQPGSDWLRQLGEHETFAVPVLCLWAGLDAIVVPQDASRLPDVPDRVFAELGHLALLLSHAVLQSLLAELEQPQ